MHRVGCMRQTGVGIHERIMDSAPSRRRVHRIAVGLLKYTKMRPPRPNRVGHVIRGRTSSITGRRRNKGVRHLCCRSSLRQTRLGSHWIAGLSRGGDPYLQDTCFAKQRVLTPFIVRFAEIHQNASSATDSRWARDTRPRIHFGAFCSLNYWKWIVLERRIIQPCSGRSIPCRAGDTHPTRAQRLVATTSLSR